MYIPTRSTRILNNSKSKMKNGHSEICWKKADSEIPQKNVFFPEFLSLLKQISVGP